MISPSMGHQLCMNHLQHGKGLLTTKLSEAEAVYQREKEKETINVVYVAPLNNGRDSDLHIYELIKVRVVSVETVFHFHYACFPNASSQVMNFVMRDERFPL